MGILSEPPMIAPSEVDPAAREVDVRPRSTGPVLVGRPASTITPTKPEWLWDAWLPLGTLVLLVGRQGSGKTTWAASVVAHLSQGRALPGASRRPPIRVGVMSLEEPADRVVGRLSASGADLGRVTIFDGVIEDGHVRPWRMPGDTGALRDRINADGLGLVVVDGLGYAISSGSGEPGYNATAGALSALGAVAADTGCSILGLTHPAKGTSDPTTSAIGSTAWTAVARVCWVLGQDPDDDDRRVVQVAKSNYREPPHGWSFEIGNDETFEVGFVRDAQPSDVPASALTVPTPSAEDRSERDEAVAWLRDVLAAGPLASSAVKRSAREAGIAEATLKRARPAAGVSIERDEGARGRPSVWILSDHRTPKSGEPKPPDPKPIPPLSRENVESTGVSAHTSSREPKPLCLVPPTPAETAESTAVGQLRDAWPGAEIAPEDEST